MGHCGIAKFHDLQQSKILDYYQIIRYVFIINYACKRFILFTRIVSTIQMILVILSIIKY